MPEQQQATENNRQKPSESQNPKLLWDTIFPDTISFFTFWLGLFTGALALVAFLQLSSLNRAEQISANIAQAAKDSAEAATQAVMLSDKTAERQLRAYVSATAIHIDIFGWERPTAIKIALQNHGQTPAYDAYAVGIVDVLPLPIPDNYIFQKFPDEAAVQRFSIYPAELFPPQHLLQGCFLSRKAGHY